MFIHFGFEWLFVQLLSSVTAARVQSFKDEVIYCLIIQLRILFVVIRFNERYLHQVLVLKRAAACFADVVIL